MACQLSLKANLNDVKTIKRYLFPDLKDSAKEDTAEGWDDFDWGWKDENPESENKEPELISWLQECQISLSPSGDLIALASGNRLVLLTRKADKKWNTTEEEVQMKYSIAFEGSVSQEDGEVVTSVLCLPLASQKRSTHGGPDWTCIIVGFSSGYVRMFTETGAALLSQIFSEESVLKIKCSTYAPPRHFADAEKHEELSVLYSKSLVTIDGFSLFQSLKACRNQVARATASGSELLPPPPLAYKKWAFGDQEQVVDHVSCGLVSLNPFDQLRTCTLNANSSYGSPGAASNLYVTAGAGPYVGFFYTLQGGSQPLLSDVAHAVASKLKSAIYSQISNAGGWFGLGRSQADQSRDRKKPKIEPATTLHARRSLYDKRRVGETIVMSPDNRLAVTNDSFGRVILIDITRGVAVRMWKGYRDAQVGWVKVVEDALPDVDSSVDRREMRHALFIVIYAPRRGLLEVWAAQHGPRVAAFNVSKCCRLLCPDYGLLGLNNVTCRDFSAMTHNVFIIDPDGAIRSVEIPFHLALGDKNSKRVRDLHLLKQLKLLLKEQTSVTDDLLSKVAEILLDIKTASIRQQGVERVLHTTYLSVDFMQNVLNTVKDQINSLAAEYSTETVNDHVLDYECRALLQFCESNHLLLELYQKLFHLTVGAGNITDVTQSSVKQVLVDVLSMNSEDADRIIDLTDNYTQLVPQVISTRVHFASDLPQNITVVDFLSCFECCPGKMPTADADHATDGGGVHVSVVKTLSETRKRRLGRFFFNSYLADINCCKRFQELFQMVHIPPDHLMQLLLHLWLNEGHFSLSSVEQLLSLVSQLSSMRVDTTDKESWWHLYREACTKSIHISSALMMALVGRRVVMSESSQTTTDAEANQTTTPSTEMSDWEPIVMEHEQWTTLVRQLEDLMSVQCLLDMKPSPSLLTKPAWEPDVLTISLKQVLEKGRGVIPELVAKWISGYGIAPSFLCITMPEISDNIVGSDDIPTASSTDKQHAKLSSMKSRSLSLSGNPVVRQLQEIELRLPLTLSVDTLMANCAWEYVVIWNRDPESIYALEQAIVYLKCIQNAVLQHGLASMIWHMFIVKKLSAASLLIEKVGKAPKDRLCRKDIGVSEASLEKFIASAIDLLETLAQARQDSHESPVFMVEDLWQSIQGPASFVELAVEQKQANVELVEHHYILCVILHAIVLFAMKSVKPLSTLFDTKGRNAFFNPLHSVPLLTYDVFDETIINARQQFFCRVITHAVCAADNAPHLPPVSIKWPALVLKLAVPLRLEVDALTRHHVTELYCSGYDKSAQEVLPSVNCHAEMGSELLTIAGRRLAHFIFQCDPPGSLEKLAKCSPTLSSWLRSLNTGELRCTNPPLSATASLVSHVINQLSESQTEYKLALELVELIQLFL